MNQTDFFADTSEMAERCRGVDWGGTPLGPVDHWPSSLRGAVAITLRSGFPMILVWGPALVQIYNEAYSSLIGMKDRAALGTPTHKSGPEVRHLQKSTLPRRFA